MAGAEPVLVRVHQLNLLDVLGAGAHQGTPLAAAMEAVAAEGCGVIVIIREPRPDSLSERVRAADAEAPQPALRDYGVGAQIIRDLGVRNMIVLSNTPRTVVGLEGYGLSIVGHRGLDNEPEKKNG